MLSKARGPKRMCKRGRIVLSALLCLFTFDLLARESRWIKIDTSRGFFQRWGETIKRHSFERTLYIALLLLGGSSNPRSWSDRSPCSIRGHDNGRATRSGKSVKTKRARVYREWWVCNKKYNECRSPANNSDCCTARKKAAVFEPRDILARDCDQPRNYCRRWSFLASQSRLDYKHTRNGTSAPWRGVEKAVTHSRCVKPSQRAPPLCRLRPKAARVTAEQWNLPGLAKKGGEKKWIGNAELRGEERYVCSYSRRNVSTDRIQ